MALTMGGGWGQGGAGMSHAIGAVHTLASGSDGLVGAEAGAEVLAPRTQQEWGLAAARLHISSTN